MTFDADGTLYADDFALRRIYKYHAQGPRSTFKTLTSPTYGLAVNESEDVFVTQGPAATIAKIMQSGTQTTFASGSPFQPVGIEISDSAIYVSSFGSVFKYSADGASRSTLASTLSNVGVLAIEVAPIPEPTTAPFGLALAGFCGAARRRTRRV